MEGEIALEAPREQAAVADLAQRYEVMQMMKSVAQEGRREEDPGQRRRARRDQDQHQQAGLEHTTKAAAWLASDDSEYVIGTTLFVEGGMTLYPAFRGNG